MRKGLQQRIDEASRIMETALSEAARPLIAYSGGKDSIVAAHIARHRFGIKDAFAELSFYFKFQAAETVSSAAALGLELTWADSKSLTWLQENQHFIFTTVSANRARLFALRHWKSIKAAAENGNHDAVIFGRRNQENSITAEITRKDGRLQVFPIRYWRLEDIWAYFEEYQIPIPKIYSSPCRQMGQAPWTSYSRPDGDRDLLWRDMYLTEPATVEEVAGFIPEAARWLQKKEQYLS